MFTFQFKDRKTSYSDFFAGLGNELLEKAIDAYAEELHGKAASVVDPETGKRAVVFVRKIRKDKLVLYTNGSSAFARALEERLGLSSGEVKGMHEPVIRERLVYLAHATEDKHVAKPLAEGLVERGIPVWLDSWEIGYGDSLRRKMEQGLGECTHFIVLLTKKSVTKPWVNEEIDAGLMSAVEGKAKFIALRHDLSLDSVSAFMRTRLTPEYVEGSEGLDTLAAQVYGISKRPPVGEKPRYVQTHEPGSTWSPAARIVAEYFVRNSITGQSRDPQADYETIADATGLPYIDVRIGVLDLLGAGLLEKKEYSDNISNIWPKEDLFVTFDKEFMEWDPEQDARDLAVRLFNLNAGHYIGCPEVASSLGWPARRFNPAVAYLILARIVSSHEHFCEGEYWPPAVGAGDELLRFVRNL